MRTVIVHQPCIISVADDASIKQEVIRQNSSILCGGWPSNVPFIGGIKELIGNPNYFLSESICEMLCEESILSRTPTLDENGKQRKLKLKGKDELLWDYSWTDVSLEVLSDDKIVQLAWDLRFHRNFCHISTIDNEEVCDNDDEDDEVTLDPLDDDSDE